MQPNKRTPDTTTLRIGKTKPFLIRNDKLAVLGRDAAKQYNLADFAARKTMISVKSARKPTPSQRLEQLLKEHKRELQNTITGKRRLRKRPDIKAKRAAAKAVATVSSTDDNEPIITIQRTGNV